VRRVGGGPLIVSAQIHGRRAVCLDGLGSDGGGAGGGREGRVLRVWFGCKA